MKEQIVKMIIDNMDGDVIRDRSGVSIDINYKRRFLGQSLYLGEFRDKSDSAVKRSIADDIYSFEVAPMLNPIKKELEKCAWELRKTALSVDDADRVEAVISSLLSIANKM